MGDSAGALALLIEKVRSVSLSQTASIKHLRTQKNYVEKRQQRIIFNVFFSSLHFALGVGILILMKHKLMERKCIRTRTEKTVFVLNFVFSREIPFFSVKCESDMLIQ